MQLKVSRPKGDFDMPPVPPEFSPILRRFSHRLAMQDVVAFEAFAGFSGARVWRVATSNAAWALRQWPRAALPSERIRGLHRLLSHIEQCGLSCVAVPVADDAGDTLISDGVHVWQLEPWLPGIADFRRDPNPLRLEAVMRLLAEWHHGAATFVPADDCRRWFASQSAALSPAVIERLNLWRQSRRVLSQSRSALQAFPAPEWRTLCEDALNLVERLGPRIASELSASEAVPVTLQPCLRDIWHDHVLFTGNRITGLIDPSACRTESVAADLSRLLGSLIEDDLAAWEAALKTYRQIRPLSVAEESLIGVLDRSGIVLSLLTWLKWLFVERRAFPDMAAAEKRLRHLHRRLVRLAQGM